MEEREANLISKIACDEARTKDSILNDEQELATIDPIRLYKEKTCKNGGIKYRKSREFNDFIFELFLSKEAHKDVISLSSKCSRLPQISMFNLSNISNEFSSSLNLFLNSVAPQKMDTFRFGGMKDKNLLDTENYIQALIQVCESATNKVEFYNCSFSNSSMQLIVKACSQIHTLTFQSCNFNDSNEVANQNLKNERTKIEI